MAIIPRLNSDYQEQDSEFNDKCIAHMDDLARDGLRTLMFAKRILTEEIAQKALSKESDTELFESNLELLGVTGLEDLLQDNVKGCI
jgi:phospholipid-translocating ATPase